jgi:acetyl esterase/lipase
MPNAWKAPYKPHEFQGTPLLRRSHDGLDGVQALRTVRARASEWGVDPARLGMIGFSAGGMVTIGALLQHEATLRPSFAAPIYGAINTGAALPADLPPVFLASAVDDFLAAGGTVVLHRALVGAGATPELHI